MNWDDLRQSWPIPEPRSSRSLDSGVNNRTQVLETASGSFVLRVYPPDRGLEHIRYELAVLQALQQKPLSFRIPVPVLTTAGETVAVSNGKVMTLTHWMPGSTPQESNLEQTRLAGHALAEVDQALAEIQPEVADQAVPFPLSGDFEGWARGTLEPSRIVQALPLESAEQRRIISLMEATQASAPALYQGLPRQIIHRDFDQSNVLTEGSSIVGVLDFEFCGPDLRVLDLAYALSQWPWGLWNTGQEWPVLTAFCQGYRKQQALTQAEGESLPQVMRLRAATGLFSRFGRYLRGLETVQSLVERIRRILEKETWLQKNADELVRRVQV